MTGTKIVALGLLVAVKAARSPFSPANKTGQFPARSCMPLPWFDKWHRSEKKLLLPVQLDRGGIVAAKAAEGGDVRFHPTCLRG